MRVLDIIRTKGSEVITLPPSATVTELVELLTARGIGAVVVMEGREVAGIVSERDVVHFMRDSADGASAISSIMTTTVTTCHPDDEIRKLAVVMTDKRIRHLPVLRDDKLVALISIGDVVKARLDDLEAERDHLERYVTS